MKVLQVTAGDAGFPHAAQLVQVRRTHTVFTTVEGRRSSTSSVEVVYLLCSLGHLAALVQKLAAWTRSHWRIENALH